MKPTSFRLVTCSATHPTSPQPSWMAGTEGDVGGGSLTDKPSLTTTGSSDAVGRKYQPLATVAARRWRLNGDTRDKGKVRRKGDEVQSELHLTLAPLARKYKTAQIS